MKLDRGTYRNANRHIILASGLILISLVFGINSLQAEIALAYDPVWQASSYGLSNGIAWTDMDGNGWQDLILAFGIDASNGPIAVYYNDISGLPTSPGWVSTSRKPFCQLSLADLDNDGDRDLVASSLGAGATSVPQYIFMNNGTQFSPDPDWQSTVNAKSFSNAVGDIDGDGDLDMAFACGDYATSNPQKSWVFFNNGGVFNTSPDWQTTNNYYAVSAAFCDIDSDGDLDLTLGGRGANISVFKNNAGVLETIPSWKTSAIVGGRQIAYGDVDNDGDLDLAVAGIAQGFYVFKNLGDSLETVPSWSCMEYTQPSKVVWADFDNDGDLDLAGGGWNAHAGIFENNDGFLSSRYVWQYGGDGSFTGYNLQGLSAYDYDQDGLVELAAAFEGDGVRKLFYIGRQPLVAISSVLVDGTELAKTAYCVDIVQGWVSLAEAPALDAEITVNYTFSEDYDLVAATLNYTCIFENIKTYERPLEGLKVLAFIGQEYGANYQLIDSAVYIKDYFDRYGWDLTTTGITPVVYPCSFASARGAQPITVDVLASDISDLSQYDALVLLPADGAYETELTHPEVLSLVSSAVDQGLIVAAWCRAVRVLAAADVIDGKKVTGHADYQSEYEAAGATYMGNVPPVTDGNLVTIIRSNFYRTEGCEAIYKACIKKRYSEYILDSTRFEDANLDGHLEAGENVKLFVFMKNMGVIDTDVTITLTTDDATLNITVPAVHYDELGGQGTAFDNLSHPFEFTLPAEFTPRYDSFFVSITSEKIYEASEFSLIQVLGIPNILLVDDDRGDNYETAYRTSFYNLGKICDVWDKSTTGPPNASYLHDYNMVCWFTGDSTLDYLTAEDIAAMKTYLTSGGSLFLTGQGLASELMIEDSLFIRNYLHCRYAGPLSFSSTHIGVAGTPLGNDLLIWLNSGTGQAPSLAQRIDAVNGGTANFTFVSPAEAGSLVAYSGNHRTVFAAWGFEAINNNMYGYATQDMLMARILEFFPEYICGDVNDDNTVNILDIVFLINYKFKGGPAPAVPDAADVNNDSAVNILDIVYLIDYKFKNGPEPYCS